MGNSKRLLFVVTQSDWGGAQTFIFKAAVEAKRRGFDVLVAAGGNGKLEEYCRRANVPFRTLQRMLRNLSPLKDLSAVTELTTLMQEWKPSTVFLNSSKAGVLGSIAAKRANIPRVIYRIGGWSFLDPVSPLQKLIRLWSEKLTAKYKDIIITVHPDDEALARREHITPRIKIVTVPNGLDVTIFDAALMSRDDARRTCLAGHQERDTGSTPLLLTVANFYPAKNLLGYLDALALVRKEKSVHAVIIGDGEERAAIESKILSLNLKDTVTLLGRRDDAATLLRGADLYVLPSVKEGMSWSLLEAMAAKTPIVATDVGSNKWMLDGNAWLVAPNHPRALADAILNALANPEQATQNANVARALVETTFNEQHLWETLFPLINEH